ncbi:hypothetical protein K7432_009620 [Basidiobolus ranarum]|uniref:Uncharacterized protein n=1 Tax=Basidiobolus ranarum TaxID=34480 RepID=A0ABR2VWT4_9FUNG
MDHSLIYTGFGMFSSFVHEYFSGVASEPQATIEKLNLDYELVSAIFTLMTLGAGLMLTYKLIKSTFWLVLGGLKLCLYACLTAIFLYCFIDADCKHNDTQFNLFAKEEIVEHGDWFLPWH